MCYVHNQWYDISCTTLYIGKSMERTRELFQMCSDRLMVGNRKDLHCFICHFVQIMHIP